MHYINAKWTIMRMHFTRIFFILRARAIAFGSLTTSAIACEKLLFIPQCDLIYF